jgi:hypothetical protein
MRTRPTRGDDSIGDFVMHGLAATAVLLSLIGAGPATAKWDGSTGQRVVTTGMDVVIVRPLAAARVAVGAALMVPASILASPACIANLFSGDDCRPIFQAPYDILVAEPADYAFHRPMGEL